jgi:ATP-dependent RNA helicase DeaD
MIRSDFAPLVGPALTEALDAKGYATLTPVQGAVLTSTHDGRDLRITSQTGSGKTVAIGLAMRAHLLAAGEPLTITRENGVKAARPRALVVVPTRELAKQVEEELAWLYSKAQVRVVSVTGGAVYRLEHRALAAGPGIVVGTPGRLLDHLDQGTIDPSGVAVVVFDEADRMLDLGFRDDLLKIVSLTPKNRLTHLCSATFPRDVKYLADRVQNDPVHVEGTPLGSVNKSIEHVIHLVDPAERIDAIVNLLLAATDFQTLIFAKTRADVAEITARLGDAGFQVGSLSGEMEQSQRNRALAAFKKGKMHALVATDVAARGIDVQDIGQVIMVDPPTDPDTYTHRSGRTGRAGRSGRSLLIVPPFALQKALFLLARAGVRPAVEPIPTATSIRDAMDERLFKALTDSDDAGATGLPTIVDDRARELAKRILATEGADEALARLIAKTRASGPSEPREIRAVAAPALRKYRDAETGGEVARPVKGPNPDAHKGAWVPFRVSYGREHGADNRRLLAIACRRGGVHSTSIGTIKVFRTHAVIEIADNVSDGFEKASGQPDPRDPRVRFKRHLDEPPAGGYDGAGDRGPSEPRERPAPAVDVDRIDLGDTTATETPIVPRERPSTATLEVRSYRTPEFVAEAVTEAPRAPRPPRPSFGDAPRAPRPAFGGDGPRPRTPRSFDGAPHGRTFDGPRPPRTFDGPRPPRTFDGPRPFDNEAPRPARTFDKDAPRPARTFDKDAPRPARAFDRDAPRPARTFDKDAPRPARTFDKDAPKAPRRIVGTEAPPSKPAKKAPAKKPVTGGEERPKKRTW